MRLGPMKFSNIDMRIDQCRTQTCEFLGPTENRNKSSDFNAESEFSHRIVVARQDFEIS